MITETLRDKLRKVLALAQSGQAGERIAAQAILDKLLLVNGLTLADIQDDKVEKTWFKIGREPEMKDLINQIYFRVTNNTEVKYYTYKNEIAYEVTKVQAAEIRELYSVYAPALRKELAKARKIAVNAFFCKNNICSDMSGDYDPKKLSSDELQRIVAVAAYAAHMKETPVHKQIEG